MRASFKVYSLKQWNEKLDLTNFYKEAAVRGFENNSSQKKMIDCFKNEKQKCAWILFKNNKAIGSVSAHSFDEVMEEDSYRVLTRVCAFADSRPSKSLLTINKMMREHQHFSDQFFLPKCIEWTNTDKIYATSNESPVASQRLVHKFYFPTLEDMKIVKKVKEIEYRNTYQTVWRIDPDAFLKSLNKNYRWCS